MAMIQSSYPGNQSLTQSDAPGYGPTDYLQALLGRENQALVQQQMARAPVNPGYRSGFSLGGDGNPAFQALAQRPQMQERPFNLQDEEFKRQQQAAQMAEMQAKSQPLPERLSSHMYGTINAMTPDTHQMTGAQREIYFGGATKQY